MTMDRSIVAYIAVSPHGKLIPSTIRSTPDVAWQALRDSISEPDTLIDSGWHICRVAGTAMERLPDESTRQSDVQNRGLAR